MITPTAACAHSSVASHGVEPSDPSKLASVLAEEHETGWCRDCSQYVHRELGGSAWKLRIGYETGGGAGARMASRLGAADVGGRRGR
jgi:hypothetical protein